MRQALIPGSFDPITCGHVDVIARVTPRFDRVYVAVMTNDMRKYVADAPIKQYMFTMEERREMAALACANLPGVEVITWDGMLIDLCDRLGVDWIIKGLRNQEDYTYEQAHALWNRAHNPAAETLYLPTDPRYAHISSTRVREAISAGDSLCGLVPPVLCDWIATHPRGGTAYTKKQI